MLKYAVIITATAFKAWQLACIQNLERSGLAHLACIAVVAQDFSNRTGEQFWKTLNAPTQLPVEVPEPSIELSSAACSEKLRSLDLDFCLLFGARELGLDLTDAAKYGVWYFAHTDLTRFSSDVPGFWEIYYNHDVTGAMLLKIADRRTAGVVLRSGYFPTRHDSLQENVDAVFASMRTWPALVCKDIDQGSHLYFNDAPVACPSTHYEAPNRQQMLAVALLRTKDRLIRGVGREFYREDWNVARLEGAPNEFIGRDARACVHYVWPYKKELYLADPWVISRDEKTYMFCEEFDYRTYRGRVVVSEFPPSGSFRPQPAIEEPFHLSYPQVFEHNGALFCVPESAETRKVCLYRSIEFPQRWQKVHTLIDGFSAVDSTLLQYDNRWWLFCTSSEAAYRGFNSHLYIWYADDLYGTWRQHASNPVKIDVRSSRPAGPFFTHGEQLVRPAQDCSRTYGSAIRLNRIDKLTEKEFKETVVGVIRPPATQYNQGIHMISCAGDCCIVDVKRWAFHPRGIATVLKRATKAFVLRAGVPAKTFESLKKRYL